MDNSDFFDHALKHHLGVIYPDADLSGIATKLIKALRLTDDMKKGTHPPMTLWDENDIVMITYGNSLISDGEAPLRTLLEFSQSRLNDAINSIHILPFFPYSSDDGFSVIDFYAVNRDMGSWQDIEALAKHYRIMADLVINHCSAESEWFSNYKKNQSPGKDWFFAVNPDTFDISQVVRPRTSPLLRETHTTEGKKQVWCTFSHDQVDLNFRNPEVLIEFVRIIRRYLDIGIRIFRLDAVGFLWKSPGTSCLSLEQTHEIIRLLRLLIEHATPDAVIITETNIPNRENLSYFGNGNEAHAIYNFALPPLLVNTLITGDCSYLKQWMMSMPPARLGTCYLNFIASHDGIGLRPVEGLIDDAAMKSLIDTMTNFGGRISRRSTSDGNSKPYEINIALFDALKGTVAGEDDHAVQRFICAHAIMMALEGIPAIYIHSFLATLNDNERVAATQHNRAINRHQWSMEDLQQKLHGDTHHKSVFTAMKTLLLIRKNQPAFHPNATQFTLHLGKAIFGFWRQSLDKTQSIFCIYNISKDIRVTPLSALNLIVTDDWFDLISGEKYDSINETLSLKPYQALWITNVTDKREPVS